MANPHGYYGGQSGQDQQFPQSNPWADQVGHSQPQYQTQQQQQQHPQGQDHSQYPYQQSNPSSQPHQQQAGYEAPSGPLPRRTNTFNETNFVPAEERGEQREALEHFEMNNTKPESQTDRDVAQLQQEFPNLDGSLIAALYSDSGSLGATREML